MTLKGKVPAVPIQPNKAVFQAGTGINYCYDIAVSHFATVPQVLQPTINNARFCPLDLVLFQF